MAGLFNMLGVGLLWLILIPLTAGLGLIPFAAWAYFVFTDSNKRIQKSFAKLEDTLIEGEGLIHKGIDTRPFALFSRRQVFGITNSRVILLNRGLLGGFNMKDFQWKDLHDAKVSENVLPNVCGSTVTISNYATSEVTFYPESEIANLIYKVAQKEEQEWEERNRIRAMEEKRAASGGIMMGGGFAAIPQPQTQQDSSSLSDEIIKYKKMLDDGIISDSEFSELKAKLLSKGNNF